MRIPIGNNGAITQYFAKKVIFMEFQGHFSGRHINRFVSYIVDSFLFRKLSLDVNFVPFLDLSNSQTYKIIQYILMHSVQNPQANIQQKMIVDNTQVSKAWVSKVLKRLENKEYLKKTGRRYFLRKPLDLISLFPLFRSMNSQLIQSFNVNADRKELLNFLKQKKAVLCSTTALQYYSSYFKDPTLNVYSESKELLNEFEKLENGLTRINVYKPDMILETDIEKKHGFLVTSKIRTLIDLFCDNKAHAGEELIKSLW